MKKKNIRKISHMKKNYFFEEKFIPIKEYPDLIIKIINL